MVQNRQEIDLEAPAGYEIGRLVDQSGGMVDRTVHPVLLNDNEASVLRNVSLDEKGTVRTTSGRIARFPAAFDADNPCNGIAAFYPDPTTTRLVIGAGTRLFSDTPHLLQRWTDQAHFQEAGSEHINADTTTTPGDIRVGTSVPTVTFARASTAHQRNGAQVASGVPRYEHHRFPHHRWQDLFDTDQIATHYTSGGDVAGATAVSDGVLSYSGGEQATLLRSGLALADGEITVNTDQAGNAGVVFRHVDNNNYYMVSFIDDSGVLPHQNVRVIRRVAGVFTELAVVDFVWPRGTAQQFRVTFHGSLIEVWHGNVRVLSVTDTTFTTGGVGLRNNHATAFRVLDWTVNQAQQGMMVEEGVTNLLSANQSSVETDLTGFHSHVGATLVRDTAQFWNGGASIRADCDGTATAQGWMGAHVPANPSQPHTFSVWIRGSGQLQIVVHEFDSAINYLGVLVQNTSITATNTWTRHTVTGTTRANTAQLRCDLYTTTAQAVTFWADGLQLEQRAYATSWQLGGTPRVAETLTVPTANVFNRGNWTIEGIYTPQIPTNVGGINKVLFGMEIDANNWYFFGVGLRGEWHFRIDSGGVIRAFSSADNAVIQGTPYHWQISGDGTTMRLCVNGVQVGEMTYTEPVGTIPANMFIGSAGGWWANGVISNLRISLTARSLAEHQTAYNAGTPLASTAETTCLALFNNTLSATGFSGFRWISAAKDISMAVNTLTGRIDRSVTLPGTSTVTIETRTSADQLTWDAWTLIAGDGAIQSTHRNHIQVRVRGLPDGTNNPSVQELLLSYDGTPSATERATGFSAGGQFFFATLLSRLVIVNRLDAPRVWDGTNPVSVLAGSPPRAQYVAAHKNYMFMANTLATPNRLFFSAVLNLESWPVLNFIDISPNDGDYITGLLPYEDFLLIAKQRSIWLLVGSGPSDFEIRRIHDGIGCIAPRSLVKVGELFGFASSQGFYLSNLSAPTLITERLRETWRGLNQLRLQQVTVDHYDHKLRIDAPTGNSTVNNLRLVFDTIRRCLYLESLSQHASCYTKFMEKGQEVLLYGHSTEGQVSQSDTGTSDAGAVIPFEWATKHFNFGSSATEKKLRDLYLSVVPANGNVTVDVRFVVDGTEIPTPVSITVPGSSSGMIRTVRLRPRDVGVRNARTIGYRITQATTNGGVRFHELLQEYMVRRVRATR